MTRPTEVARPRPWTLGPAPRASRGAGAWLQALLVLLLASGCAVPGTKLGDAAAEINATLHADPLIMDVGDLIVVEFPTNREWNQRVRVRTDGSAQFLFLGDIQVKGITEAELAARITSEYAATLQDSEVTVQVGEWAPRNAYILGELQRRGPVPITGRRLTLVEALGNNGGHQWRSAGLRRIHFIRWIPEENRYLRWKLDARIDRWADEPIYLQPYDLIYVQPSVITVVNNWIDVYIRRMIPLPYLIARAEDSLATF